MSESKPETPENETPEEEAATPDAADSGEDAPSEESALSNRLLNMEAELADTKDRLMRAVAETENIRRRSEREKSETSQYAVTKFARDILSVADNLRRALDSVPEEARGEDSPLASFLSGVDMTERELLSVFERHGIKKIDPAGEKFDHNFHQAMSEIETTDTPPGHVVQAFQPGYVLADRLLRPAMVVVAKAPKPAAAAPKPEGVDKTV